MSNTSPPTKKSLGQHWLHDVDILNAMCDAAQINTSDTVLEIGPGPGTLTAQLVQRAKQVIAVEFDEALARELPKRVPAANLQVVHQDIMRYDLRQLPAGYKVAANIPYYLTSNLLRILCESDSPFSSAAILMQKEVAERICAAPGDMSLLAVSVQFYCEARLGEVVPAALFIPPPKVDSQILILERRSSTLVPSADTAQFFRIVKAGFSQRRKTLLNTLSAGLHLGKPQTSALLAKANIDPKLRAQNLSLSMWYDLYNAYKFL